MNNQKRKINELMNKIKMSHRKMSKKRNLKTRQIKINKSLINKVKNKLKNRSQSKWIRRSRQINQYRIRKWKKAKKGNNKTK